SLGEKSSNPDWVSDSCKILVQKSTDDPLSLRSRHRPNRTITKAQRHRRTRSIIRCDLAISRSLNQQQRRVFQQVTKFLQVLCAQRAVDNAMVAAHRDGHSMADHHLITVVNDRAFSYLAYGEDEALGWINDSRE